MIVATGGVMLAAGLVLGASRGSRNPSAPGALPASPEGTCQGVNVPVGSALQAAFDSAPEGTTFCLGPGVYRLAEPIIPKSGSVIWGSPGTILNGSRPLTGARHSSPHWVLPGAAQPSASSRTPCEPDAPAGCELRQNVFYDDRPLAQVASVGEVGPGEFFFDPGTEAIYLADDPTGHTVELAVTSSAIATAYGDLRRDNVTVRGLVVEKFAGTPARRTAALRAGWNWRIENNEIRLNGSAGVAVETGGVLRNNGIHHNGQYGFLGGPLHSLTVENNDISFNNTSGSGDDGGGGKIVRSTNVVFLSNKVHDNAGPGLRTQNGNVNVTYEGNTLERNAGPGIAHDGSADAVIRRNVFRQNGLPYRGKSLFRVADLHLTNSENVEIAANTIDAGVNGIGLVDIDVASTQGVLATRGIYVHDNTIRMRDGGFTGLVGSRSPAYTTANNRFERNTYHVTDVSVIFFMWQSACSWKDWQAKGQDLGGTIQTWTPGLNEPALPVPAASTGALGASRR